MAINYRLAGGYNISHPECGLRFSQDEEVFA